MSKRKRHSLINETLQKSCEQKVVNKKMEEVASILQSCDPSLINDKTLGRYVLEKKVGETIVESVIELDRAIPFVWPSNLRNGILINELNVTKEHLGWIRKFEKCQASLQPSEKLKYLGPPTGTCLECEGNLQRHNNYVKIKFLTIRGACLDKKKLTLRCIMCKMNYGFDKYGNEKEGYRFYDSERDAVQANDAVLIDRKIVHLHSSFALHCWVSFEGFGESWHDGNDFQKSDEIDIRVWARAFWWSEVERDLHESGEIHFRFKRDSDLEKAMMHIDAKRKEGLYSHTKCSVECKARGCGRLWVTDGIWTLQFPHCMFHTESKIDSIPLLTLPPVCTNQPMPGQAFCAFHCEEASKNKPPIPTKIREFLKFADANADEDADEEEEEVDSATGAPHMLEHNYASPVILDQGGQEFIARFADQVKDVAGSVEDDKEDHPCRKNLGERKSLRKMSRGHQFVVRAGGHIDMWTPLYKSESLGQVFLFIVSWLYLTLKDMPAHTWKLIFLAYDNMCQLIRYKPAKSNLPLPSPFDKMWSSIRHIIDGMHISNHVQKLCHTDLHPDRIYDVHPDLREHRNTQAGEQTFVWLSRFKKILSSMTKTHHMFYLHRLIKRRNDYLAKCYEKRKKTIDTKE